jgi:protein-tyrosine phosphatase
MYAYANPVDWFVREIRYGVWDSNMKDFDAEELFDIVRVAHSDWKRGKKVLIRCQAGWNRSGLITALVLIREGMEAQKAINLIREKRSPHALCNSTFATWLLAQDPSDWKGNSYGTTRRVK